MNPGDLVKVFKHRYYAERDVLGVGLYLGNESKMSWAFHLQEDTFFRVLMGGTVRHFDTRYYTLFLVPRAR